MFGFRKYNSTIHEIYCVTNIIEVQEFLKLNIDFQIKYWYLPKYCVNLFASY